MSQQHETEPNMTDLPEIYSTMPSKWVKWQRTVTNEQKDNLLKALGFYGSKKPLSATFTGQK